MPIRPDSHRASGRASRARLLDAAIEVIAERGIGATTHRAVAARAGVPLSTTSYFFASIDDLIVEALRSVIDAVVARLQPLTAALATGHRSAEETLDAVVAALTGTPEIHIAAQFEAYLAATRRPALQQEVQRAISACEHLAEAALHVVGGQDPHAGARAVVALIDGFALHRLAWPRKTDDTTTLTTALRAVLDSYAQHNPTALIEG
jgi:DNA-binding transcriptional regulator YbjK